MIHLSDLMADHQEFHSDLQMDSFITGRNGGTLYGCYKQALREVATRITALRERYFGIELLHAEIDEHQEKGTRVDLIKAKHKQSCIPQVEHTLLHTEREFLRFVGQALALREVMQHQGIEFPLSAETRHRLDCEMWVHQLKCRAAIAAMTGGRVDNSTIELIQSLPANIRKEVCDAIFSDQGNKLMEWFMEFELKVPEPKPIDIDPRKLIGCSP